MSNIKSQLNTESKVSLSEILKSARESQNWSLEKLSAETGVHIGHLKNLEAGYFESLPPDVYTIGIIKKYAKIFNLSQEELINLYLKERAGCQLSSGVNDQLVKQSFRYFYNFRKFTFTPKLVIYLLLFLILGCFIWMELNYLILPPIIELDYPKTDLTINQPLLVIKGKVLRTKSLTINQKEIYFDNRGHFEYALNLTNGLNIIDIKAVNNQGHKSTQIERRVIYQLLAP